MIRRSNLLYATALCVGIAETVYDTAAQSILPQIVPRDRLDAANSRLFAVELTSHEFVGPPLAGLLVAAGATVAPATPLGLWGVAIGAMLMLRGTFRATGQAVDSARDTRRSIRADIAEGLRFVGHNRLLRALAAMTGAFNFATTATFAVFVLYATGHASETHLSKQAYGILLAMIAGGSVLGSFFAERVIRTIGRSRTLALSIPAGALMVGAPAWGVMPVGAAVGGILAQVLGLRAVFAVMAVLMLGILLGLRVVTDDRMAEAERQIDHRAEHPAEQPTEAPAGHESESPAALP
jgi:predicted MFS family arabinose efflux permease